MEKWAPNVSKGHFGQKMGCRCLGGSISTNRSCEGWKRRFEERISGLPSERDDPAMSQDAKNHVINSPIHSLMVCNCVWASKRTYNLVVYTCLYHSHGILDHLQWLYLHPRCLAKVLNQQPCVHLSVFHPLTGVPPKTLGVLWPLPTTQGSFKKGKRRFDLSLIRWKSGPNPPPGNKEIPNLENHHVQGPCSFSRGVQAIGSIERLMKQCYLQVRTLKMTLQKVIIAPCLSESYSSKKKHVAI